MANFYWIKLYHEILHDPKMARLPDNLWRRVIELFLLAGEHDGDGFLPDVSDMTWTLRIDEEQLLAELNQLAEHEIVEEIDGCWYVTHFEERQKAFTNAEKQRNYRERKRKEQYYGEDKDAIPTDNQSVTECVTSGNTDIDKSRVDNTEQYSPPSGGNGVSKKKLRQRSQREIDIDKLVDYFTKITGIPTEQKHATRQKLWRTPLGDLLDNLEGDTEKATRIMSRTVSAMRRDKLRVANPNSIYNVAMSEIGESFDGRKVVTV